MPQWLFRVHYWGSVGREILRYQVIENSLTFIIITLHFLLNVRVCLGVMKADGTLNS